MTLQELEQRTLESIDLLLSLHSKEECSENCVFCIEEAILEYAPLEIVVDDLLESHIGRHRKKIGYPFNSCEYCIQEKWIVNNKGFTFGERLL